MLIAGPARGIPIAMPQTVDAEHPKDIRFRQSFGDPVVLCAVMLFGCLAVRTVAADVRLVPSERWSTVFADEEVPIVMTVLGDDVVGGTVRWSHAINTRTLDSGSVAVVDDEVQRGKAELMLGPQPLREGVILETTLSTRFIPRGTDVVAASHIQKLWLFPRDPLAGRSEWAAGLDIRLFDPGRKTADAFDEIELPYTLIQNPARLNDPDWSGILIIGEGTPLRRHPVLPEAVIEAAASGRRVVLLSPVDGSLAVPGLDLRHQHGEIPVPTELRFARRRAITGFDKRLDHLAWPGTNNTVPARGLSMESHRGRLLATVSDNPHAWPLVVLKYADHDGQLVMCGFEVIAHWDAGPTPRYLLIRLLEGLSQQASTPGHPLRQR